MTLEPQRQHAAALLVKVTRYQRAKAMTVVQFPPRNVSSLCRRLAIAHEQWQLYLDGPHRNAEEKYCDGVSYQSSGLERADARQEAMGRQCERLLDEILSTPAASVDEVVQKMYAANLTHWTEDLDGKLAQIWQSVLEDLVTLADTPRLTDNATQADALQPSVLAVILIAGAPLGVGVMKLVSEYLADALKFERLAAEEQNEDLKLSLTLIVFARES